MIQFPPCILQAYTYDTLPSRKVPADAGPGQETYDIPPRREAHPAAHLGYRTIPGARRQASKDLQKEDTDSCDSSVDQQRTVQKQGSFSQDIYDVPPNHHQTGTNNNVGPTEHYDTLPKHAGGVTTNPNTKVKLEKAPVRKTDVFGSPKKVNPNVSQLKLPTSSSSPMDIYDAPSAFKHHQQQQQEVYDVPPSHAPEGVILGEVYDIPTHRQYGGSLPSSPRDKKDMKRIAGHQVITKTYSQDVYDVPTHSISHTKQSMDYTYDVPPQVSRDKPAEADKVTGNTAVQDLEGKVSVLSLSKNPRSGKSDVGFPKGMLEIAREDAGDTLTKKQQNLDSSSAYLLSYVSSTWRQMENLEPRVFEIRAACNQLKLASKEYLEFAEGVVANALQIHDDALFGKLSKLLVALKSAYEGLEKTATSMSDTNWEAAQLCSKPENDEALLDSFVLSAKTITDSAKRFCSVVQDNICALFKRTGNMQERPLPTPPSETGSLRSSTWVAAEKEGMVTKEPVQVRPLPVPPQNVPTVDDDTMNTYEELPSVNERNEEPPKIADYGYLSKDSHIIPVRQEDALSDKDRQILQFYSGEIETLSNSITSAVELFFSSVEGNQPPKIFVSHSKHVIILGHKLVFIGDTIHLNLQNNSLKQRIILTNDTLCACLSSAVNSTKAAALQFPGVPAMQEMVDRITDVANATQDLRNVILVGGN